MRRLVYVLILIIVPLIMTAQYRVTNGSGLSVTLGGLVKSAGIPVYAEVPEPEEYEYADSDSIEIIHSIDFDDFSVQSAPLISYVEARMPNDGYIGGDTGVVANTIAFVDLGGGDIILQNIYEEGWCCTESDYPDVDNAGTGVIWAEYFNSAHTPRDTFFITSIWWFEPEFMIGDGMKFNGTFSLASGARDDRVQFNMITDWAGTTDSLQWQFYDWAFDDEEDEETSAKATLGQSSGYGIYPDTIPRGRWVCFTTLNYGGTVDTYDALHAMWMDDTCRNYRNGIMMQNTADGNYGFDMLDIETFFGGDTNDYNSPRTQDAYLYSITAWKTINGYSMYPDMTDTPTNEQVIKQPIETGWPVTTNPE